MKIHTGCITSNPDLDCREADRLAIYAPAVLALAGNLPLEVAGLPLGNPNTVTLQELKRLKGGPPRHGYCGIFALDPFLNAQEFISATQEAGFHGICNYPTLPDFGPEEEVSLAASGYSYEKEIEALCAIATNHLKLAVYCPTASHTKKAKSVLRSYPAEWRIIHQMLRA